MNDIQCRVEIVDGFVAEIIGEDEGVLTETCGIQDIAGTADQDLMGVEGRSRSERGAAGAAVEDGIVISAGG